MQSESERVLHNLHVLSVLSHNDKLLTNDDAFDIHSPTTWRAAWRFWSGERRGTNVARVRVCVRHAIDFTSKTLEETACLLEQVLRAADGGFEDPTAASLNLTRLKIETAVLHHVRMLEALKKARGGIENLVQTYRDDPAMASQVKLLVDEVDDFTRVIEPHSLTLRARCAEGAAREGIARRTLTHSGPLPNAP